MVRHGRAAFVALTLVGTNALGFVWPSTVDRVTHDLGDANTAVRRRAARRLFDLSPGVVRRVALPALDDPDPEVRVAALEALMEARARGLGARVSLRGSEMPIRAFGVPRRFRSPGTPRRTRYRCSGACSRPGEFRARRRAKALGASGTRAAVVPLLGRLDDSIPMCERPSSRPYPAWEIAEASSRSSERSRTTGPACAGRWLRHSVCSGMRGASGPLLLLLRDSEGVGTSRSAPGARAHPSRRRGRYHRVAPWRRAPPRRARSGVRRPFRDSVGRRYRRARRCALARRPAGAFAHSGGSQHAGDRAVPKLVASARAAVVGSGGRLCAHAR